MKSYNQPQNKQQKTTAKTWKENIQEFNSELYGGKIHLKRK